MSTTQTRNVGNPTARMTLSPDSIPKADRFDDLFGWEHARVLKAAMDADEQGETLNIKPFLARHHWYMSCIDRLISSKWLEVLSEQEDPAGHQVRITKQGVAGYKAWVKKNPGGDPGERETAAAREKAATNMTRDANGLDRPEVVEAKRAAAESAAAASPAAPVDPIDDFDVDDADDAPPPAPEIVAGRHKAAAVKPSSARKAS